MRISVELTPRDLDSLVRELRIVRHELGGADLINIPDLLRFAIRSWEACKAARQFFKTAIPHIRAIDIDPHAPLPMREFLIQHDIREVLVVSGDPPQDMSRKVYPVTAIDIIAKFKREMPEVRVYAALDPYRHGFHEERDRARRKLEAGADGFFTQPFFDPRLMEIYAEVVDPKSVFWGVSPVLTERSRNYWETTNRVLFPRDFRPTLEWNRQFARRALDFARQMESNVYFMPIKVDLVQYLGGIV